MDKFNNQTTLEAKKWIQDGRKINGIKVIYKSMGRFLRNYFGKQGFRDGFLGFMMSIFHGFYQLLSYAKYLEMKNEKR